ncbi:MAG: HlyC/CorC family transporter [Lachnospiraceae bacterium]|nr:HlyC/CorC family transporter [Lachnospiraceae bacterium]
MESFFKRLKRGSKDENVIENEIMSMVSAGQDQGVLEESEAEMIGNIFTLNDKDCSDIMIPRKKMCCLDGNESLSDLLPRITQSTFSRFPVYENDIDHVIGLLHIKDVLSYLAGGGDCSVPLKEIPNIMQNAVFVPESKTISTLLPELKEQKTHMAIVVDEYGQTTGIVAMEDILEEIVGNILDEHDEEEDGIHPQGKGFGFPGTEAPSEVYEALKVEAEPPDFDTMSGFLIAKLGHIPENGERFFVDADGFRFYATDCRDHMVGRIHAEPIEAESDSGS